MNVIKYLFINCMVSLAYDMMGEYNKNFYYFSQVTFSQKPMLSL